MRVYLNSATRACGLRSSAWKRASIVLGFGVPAQASQGEERPVVGAPQQRLAC